MGLPAGREAGGQSNIIVKMLIILKSLALGRGFGWGPENDFYKYFSCIKTPYNHTFSKTTRSELSFDGLSKASSGILLILWSPEVGNHPKTAEISTPAGGLILTNSSIPD